MEGGEWLSWSFIIIIYKTLFFLFLIALDTIFNDANSPPPLSGYPLNRIKAMAKEDPDIKQISAEATFLLKRSAVTRGGEGIWRSDG